MKIALAFIMLFMAICLSGIDADAARISNQSCLSYWAVGDSGCDGSKKPEKKKAKEESLLPESKLEMPESKLPERITPDSEDPIEEKVDEFLDNFEKPPREFAKFQMEPTLDNAMSWVRKYNDMVSHSGRIAAAWRQAQEIYSQAEQTGVVLPGMQGQQLQIPNYQQQLALTNPNLAASLLAQAEGAQAPNAPQNRRIGGLSNTENIGSLTPDEAFAGANAGNGRIKVNYYFSAECPYCEKFEPEFRRVMKSMPGKLDVTCVDMTPSGQTEANIYGKLDCAWRPLDIGEMEELGVTATPTLVIDRGDGSPLQRIPGYVDEANLKKFLLTNKTN